MPKRKQMSDKDLTNMARGFDSPPEKQHLERIRQMAKEIELEAGKELGKDKGKSGLGDFFKKKDKRPPEHEMDGMDR